MTTKKRQPKGIPVGGQFAVTAKGAAPDIHLDNATAPSEGIARDVLAAALDRHGLDETLTGLDARTITEAWDEKFAPLDGAEHPTTMQAVYDALGGINIGRHRGGPWLVWYDPSLRTFDEEDWGGERTGQWEVVTADNVDDPRGRVLAAQFHTRNGGGNRECWCDADEKDSPEHGCTAQIVEDLINRPDHLHDADDDGDRTYADFYFRLPEDAADDLIASVRGEERAQARRNAQRLLESIEAGEKGPWEVFDINPSVEEPLREAEAAAREEFPKRSTRLVPHLPFNPSVEDLAFVDGVVDAVAAAQEPPVATAAWQRGHVFSAFTKAAQDEQHAYHEDKDLRSVLVECRAGRLPDEVIRALGGVAQVERKVETASRRLVGAQTRLTERRNAVEEARGYLRDHLAVQARRGAAQEQHARLEWARRWPGPVEACPPGPAGSQGGAGGKSGW